MRKNKKDVLKSINSAIGQGLIVSKNSLAYLYSMNNESFSRRIDNFDIDDDFISDTDLRNQTIMLTKKSKAEYFQLEESYAYLDKINLLTSALIVRSDTAQEVLSNVKTALQSINEIVLFAVSHIDMTETQLSSYKNSLNNYIIQIENTLLSQDSGIAIGLMGSRQALLNLNIERESQINKDIEKSVKQLEIINANIASLKDNLESNTKVAESML